jgi:hypothetical protein
VEEEFAQYSDCLGIIVESTNTVEDDREDNFLDINHSPEANIRQDSSK